MNDQKTIPVNYDDQANGASRYANVNGLKMYYEIHGQSQSAEQPPLVLLHGSFSAVGTSFSQILPGLQKNRQVIGIEQQAHGHTGDIDRPLSIQQMAEDTVALLRQAGVPQADFFGYSLGTGIALYIAIKHPEMVRRLVLAGGVVYNKEGFNPGMLAGLDGLKPEYLIGSPFHAEYMAIAPRPQDFSTLVEKVKQLNKNLHDWSPDEIRAIKAPTMLIIGDADIVQPEHVVEMFHLLGGGVPGPNGELPAARLAILPGTDHVSVVYRADWLVSMLDEFLA